MKYVRLGRTGLNVSRLALGTATYGVSPLEKDVPDMIHRGLELGITDNGNSPQELEAFLREEIDRWSRVIKTAHITSTE